MLYAALPQCWIHGKISHVLEGEDKCSACWTHYCCGAMTGLT